MDCPTPEYVSKEGGVADEVFGASRINTHIHLHINTALQVVHDACDTSFEVSPSVEVSSVCNNKAGETYVAPISSRFGIGGI